MALSGAGLKAALQNALDGLSEDELKDHDAVYTVWCNAFINYFKNNAEVSFSAGQITGVDAPTGDSHDELTASGGSIS